MISRDSAAGARPHGCGVTGETIGERLARDRQALLPLPPAPYGACDKRSGRVSSLSLLRCRGNDLLRTRGLVVSVPAHGEPQEDDAYLDKQRGIAFEMQAPFGDRTKNYEQAVGFYKNAAARETPERSNFSPTHIGTAEGCLGATYWQSLGTWLPHLCVSRKICLLSPMAWGEHRTPRRTSPAPRRNC